MSAIRKINTPYKTVSGIIEKKSAFESDSERKKRKYSIEPSIEFNMIKAIPVMPSAEKEKVNPLSLGTIPAKKYLPSQIAGTIVSTKRAIKILVESFIPLFFATKTNVCTFNGIKHAKLHILKAGGNMEGKELLQEYLNAVYQNTRTAIQSLDDIMTKVEDDNFKKYLATLQDEYHVISGECEMLAKAERISPVKDNNWFEKAKLWSSINMSTMTDKSNRKIAELLLLGTFMGIITCIKDEKDHKNISKEVDELLYKLKTLERDSIEKLITYLD